MRLPAQLHIVALLTFAGTFGCADDGDATDGATGTEAGDSEESGSAADVVDEAAVLEAASAYATTMDRVSNEARASEHALADTVHFYIESEHSELYLSIDPAAPAAVSFPTGTLIVKENLNAAGETDGYFAMYKAFEGYDPEANDWYWLRVDGAGAVGNAGQVGFCKDCHGGRAEVSDLVFGLPLDNRL